MNKSRPLSNVVFTCLALLLSSLSSAQEAPHVLFTIVVDLGPRSIIYQRTQAPVRLLPKKIAPPPSGSFADENQISAPMQMSLPKALSLSATVHDRMMTDLRWTHAGKEYRVWSSIDFNYLRGLSHFHSEDSIYHLFLGIGNESQEQTLARNALMAAQGVPTALLPAPSEVPIAFSSIRPPAGGGSWYVIISVPDSGVDPKAFFGIDALHHHYDLHHEDLIRSYMDAEAARLAEEEWRKLNPPVPTDTVIQFWPKGNRPALEVAQ